LRCGVDPGNPIDVLDQRGQLLRAVVGVAGCSMLCYEPPPLPQSRGQLLRRVRAVFVFVLFLGACAIANTPQQDLAYARWAKCNSTSATLDRVGLDGGITFRYTAPGDREAIVQCFAEAGRTGQLLPEPVGYRPVGGQ
jgi:hypothetical protein